MRTSRRQGGFTLIEMIVVLAVIGTLVALITPRIFPYIEEAKLVKAQADVNTIAAAVTKFYKDTGRWPFEKDGASSAAYAATDAAILTTNPACAGTAISGGTPCDANAPPDNSTGSSWALTTAIGDSLHNQLVYNKPFGDDGAGENPYTMSGKRAWNGPYLFNIATLDPWSRSYLVNIASADPALEGAATQEWVIAISGGPDGELDTSVGQVWTSPTPGELMPEDDDIVAVIK